MYRNMAFASIVAGLVLGVAGSAFAGASGAARHERIVKRAGAFTATLTYLHQPKNSYTPDGNVTLRIRRGGRLLLSRQICQLEAPLYGGCRWGQVYGLAVRRVGPSDTPAFVLDLWNGGNRCCEETFIAVPGRQVAWVTRSWAGADGWEGYRIMRRHGRTFFVTGDGRFFCAFSVCAGGSVPIEVWTMDRYFSFVNVTRRFPGLIRADAHTLATAGGDPRMNIRKQGSGVLAAWCGDEYRLGQGARCARVLAYAVRHHPPNMQGAEPTRGFVRALNRSLVRWGYERR